MNARALLPKHRLLCPFCLGVIEWQRNLRKCPHESCREDLPVRYVDLDMQMPPFPVQVFGWPQHGKTAYLYALTLMLTRMYKIWLRYSLSAATEDSQRRLQEINSLSRKGDKPRSTQKGADERSILLLRNMEPWGNRALLMRDCPGEVFAGMNISLEHVPFLLRARTVFMFISRHDLDGGPGSVSPQGWTMDMLLTNYVETMIRGGIRLQKEPRRLVVVLTKADLLRTLPPLIREYVTNDVLWAIVNANEPKQAMLDSRLLAPGEPAEAFMMRYLAAMWDVHSAIRDWIAEEWSGESFIRLAESYGIELRFSITSATGAEVPREGMMSTPWEPRRVLDPLFWGLELDQPSSQWARWTSLLAATAAKLEKRFHTLMPPSMAR